MNTAGMRTFLAALLFAAVATTGTAQNANPDLDQMLQVGAQWLHENLDANALADLDQAELIKLCREIDGRLKDDSVIDLAEMEPLVIALVPVLEKYEETKPYAAWLRSRVDYLTVAQQFKALPPLPPGQLIPHNPTPQAERDAWQKQLAKRPLPPRAREYLPMLKRVFTAEGLPTSLVWIAEVESTFDPRARSPVGAAGLFQLMPATAESLGLKLRPRDQRLDPEANARAAAKYLRYLYGKFKNWRLALAAYNAGEGRVRKLLDKRKATSFDSIATYLPAETQMYVPKVEAVVERREGVKLSSLKLAAQPGSALHEPG
jgi:membrane-bound lytic murein transglycosylase D